MAQAAGVGEPRNTPASIPFEVDAGVCRDLIGSPDWPYRVLPPALTTLVPGSVPIQVAPVRSVCFRFA